ncbi:carboxypeptidase-like regulatory domain-containing protein [Corallococcus sp. EGB]|uniref:carboxypeptidase-like regulatory domain-containing protein n=1 Tax=Corallococcus sp. EGB TaxID=1521117 RepID=UPI001CBCCA39|nr:carboxypeptidase-like regulatory domain-containing protein [Corallococcus sp. EGB]
MRFSWVLLGVVGLACAGPSRGVRDADATLTVRVKDAEGRPVPGARLKLLRANLSLVSPRIDSTDARGTARLHPRPGWYYVRTEAPGFVAYPEAEVRLAPGASQQLDMTLVREAPFSGRVVDAQGRPVEGVELRLFPEDPDAPWADAASDAQGHFAFTRVAPGPVVLQMYKEGWSPYRMAFTAPRAELTVVLGTFGALKVRVVDPQGRLKPGGPSGITPVVRSPDFVLFPEKTADAKLFPRLPAGRYLVTGYHEAAPDCSWSRTEEVEVQPGGLTEFTVSFEGLHGQGALRGRAVDPTGRALDGRTVRALFPGGGEDTVGLGEHCETTTGADGSFVLPELLVPVDHLELNDPEVTWRWASPPPRPGAAQEAVVFRTDWGLVEGRVLGPSGRPMEHLRVEGRPVEAPHGRFRWRTFGAEPQQWLLEAEGFASTLLRMEGQPDEVQTLPDITFDVGRVVRGCIITAEGTSVGAGLEVMLLEPSRIGVPTRTQSLQPTLEAKTDDQGCFQLGHVAGRPQLLRVDAASRGTALRELKPGETGTDLRLDPWVPLSGAVTDGERVPLEGVRLDALCEGGFFADAITDREGRYILKVPSGRECFVHALGVEQEGRRPRPPVFVFSPQRIRASSGAGASLDFAMRQGPASLRVRLPNPHESMTAFALPGDIPMPRSAQELDGLVRAGLRANPSPGMWPSESLGFVESFFFGQGEFVISALPLGHYTVFVQRQGGDGDAVIRLPVELTRAGEHLLEAEDPYDDGHGTVFPR